LKHIISRLIFLSLFCVAGAGLAAAQTACGPTINNDPNNFCLTGVGAGYGLDGIYMSPYTATVNGVMNTPVICDDFIDDVYVGETWAVNGYSLTGAAASGLFGGTSSSLTGYEEVAWLSEMLLSSPPSASGPISFAIWAVFEPTDVQSWLASDSNTYNAVFGTPAMNGLPAVQGLLAQAQTAVDGLGTSAVAAFSNVTIYTPVAGSQSCCGPPQEFVTIRTAEAPAPAVLGVEFLGLGVLLFAFRRRKFATR
jgi:hypothetical protein